MLEIKTCPTCGSRKIKKVRRAVTGVYKEHQYRANGIVFHECPVCGERLYGPEAMRKIEAAREKATAAKSSVLRSARKSTAGLFQTTQEATRLRR